MVCSAKNKITGDSIAIKKASLNICSISLCYEGELMCSLSREFAGHESVSKEDLDETCIEGIEVRRRFRSKVTTSQEN